MNDKQAAATLQSLKVAEKLIAALETAINNVETIEDYRALRADLEETELEKADLLLEICAESEESV
jgi:hypothetical protein